LESKKTYESLLQEVAALREELEETHDIINAIRDGAVDAIIVKEDNKHELYTLKSADKTYRIFIERMNEGAVTLNRNNLVLYCNSSFADFIHTGLENVIGLSFEKLVPPNYRSQVRMLIERAWAEEESKGEIELNDGSRMMPVQLSISTMEIDSESAISIIITDLSLQKEAQAQKKAMEQKDEFISIASHELKTPVTSVKGYIQLLKHKFRNQEDPNAVTLLNKADNQLKKLTNLINELLDVKKMENGQLQYNSELFDLDELVLEILEETEQAFVNHRFVYEKCESCQIQGDRNKIGQVITNLLENAGKYSPAGSIITVSTVLDNNKVTLFVKDSGMGIPESQQQRIFERFYRVNGDRENTYSGLGLGLYISAEIVKRHNGRIGVESIENRGSTFYFDIPVQQ
jgi:PAS domain S-box-containing protein